MVNYKTKKIFLICVFLFILNIGYSESVRLTTLKIIELGYDKKSVSIQYGAGVAIKIPPLHFLQGIEIEIKQGKESLSFPNSLEYQVYSCKDQLNENSFIYEADPIEKKLLPARVSTIMQLPTRENHSLKTSTYARLINYTFNTNDGFLLIRIMPIMKGLTSDFEQAFYTISAKPIFTNEGGLNINVAFPNKKTDLKITMNETPVHLPNPPEFFILPIGRYKLVLEANDYRSEIRNVIIEQAKIITLDFKLKSLVPLLYIFVPDEVTVFLDRELLAQKENPIELLVGKHTVKLQLGTYETLRQIDAEEGKTYTITMDIGVDVTIED